MIVVGVVGVTERFWMSWVPETGRNVEPPSLLRSQLLRNPTRPATWGPALAVSDPDSCHVLGSVVPTFQIFMRKVVGLVPVISPFTWYP